jgi:formamidopyrimidine-DNA glycosylase
MDQTVIAGLGNLLVDEILWRARLHPQQKPARLDSRQWGRLHRSMGQVLRGSVKVGRVPTRRSWLTGVRDKDDPVCPRCGAGLRRLRIGGRTTALCPRCQPAPATRDKSRS